MNTNIDIMIVEDSMTQGENLKFILEDHNYSVDHVFNGEEALKRLKTTLPKIIISDIVMPLMDGFTFCSKVKSDKQLKGIPFILLTSLSDTGDIINGLVSGADSFITKPFDKDFLLSKVEYLILNFKLRKDSTSEMGLEILFGGKKHLITSDKLQILDLLISTYESAVLKNNELQQSNSELQLSKNKLVHFNKNLELAVQSRTEELELANKKLLQEIEERVLSEKKQELVAKILSILNRPHEWQKLIKDILFEVKKFSGIEAAAIRLQHEDDYPYFDTLGFSSDFIKTEKSLCIKENGNIKLDSNGKPDLACFCGKVISGKTKTEQSFYTPNGSFWTNSTTGLLASKEVKEIKDTLRNRCNQNGYESMALIPVVSVKETIGLIQLNDKRTGFFTPELIAFFEGIASTIGIAYERVQYEKKITESLEFNKSLLKTIPFGMDIVNETGTILFQSENLKTIFGNDAKGKKCWELYRDDKTKCIMCPLRDKINIGETKTIISSDVLDGKIFEIIHTGMMFKGEKALLEIFMDITERNKSEQELKNALLKALESDRLKSAFLATMSHELRTPLNAVIGFSGLLKDETTMESVPYFAEVINESGNHLLNIIDDLFDISLIETNGIKLQSEVCNILGLINIVDDSIKNEQIKLNKQDISIQNEIQLSNKNLLVKTDQKRLIQILLNLLKNSLKFTEKGWIKYGVTEEKEDGKPVLKFYVQDTGIGIAEEKQCLIYDSFRQIDDSNTRKYGGAGIGLSITKKLVILLGGKIWLESMPGMGTTFYFTLPIQLIDGEIETHLIKNKDEFGLRTQTILIAEDDDPSFQFLEIILNKTGVIIIRAQNGKEAVELCKNNSDIKIVLMDLNMPVMNGYEAIKIIKSNNPNLPIIAQTAYAFKEDNEKALKAGCDDYISKPINKEGLLKKIEKYLC